MDRSVKIDYEFQDLNSNFSVSWEWGRLIGRYFVWPRIPAGGSDLV